MKNMLKNEKSMLFAGGVILGTLGVKLLKGKAARKIYVATLANGMKMQKDAQNLFETMKEDAQDMCHEASEANSEAHECCCGNKE